MFKALPFKHLPSVKSFDLWRNLKALTIARLSLKLALGVSLLVFFSGYQPTLSLPPIQKKVALAQIEPQKIEAKALPFEFQLPHPGYLSTRFSRFHPGVDIATGLGMPIKPIAPGKVTDTGYNFWGLGLVVTIEHPENFKSTYAHMGKIYVKTGQEVKKEDTLGVVGLTGQTSGPHTHLELQKDNQNIDPLTLIPPLRDYPIEEDFQAVKENKVTQKLDFKKELKNSL